VVDALGFRGDRPVGASTPSTEPPARAELEEARSLLLLQRRVGEPAVRRLLAAFGSGRAALSAGAGALEGALGPRSAARSGRTDPAAVERVERGLAWCSEHGVAVVPQGAPGYPPGLLDLEDPPAVLFLRGDPSLLEREVVAVVGSRRSTEYGRRVARDLGLALARNGVVVASGLALGIDGVAHRAALEGGGKTLAVLGCGPDRAHPPSHRGLFRRIAGEGLVVSEFLPGELPLPHHFPKRNRILAALARVVVVVEAASKSGALITAGIAGALGRRVVAVPGSIYSPASRGTNELLGEASPLLSPLTVLELLRGVGTAAVAPAAPPPDLGDDALKVWEVLEEGPGHVDDVARRVGLGTRRTLVALTLLEVGGWARQEPGMRFLRGAAAS